MNNPVNMFSPVKTAFRIVICNEYKNVQPRPTSKFHLFAVGCLNTSIYL